MTDKEIIVKYPELFGEEIFTKKENLICFKLATPKSWYPYLDILFEKISCEVLKNNLINFRITEVREKYGELRVDTDRETIEIQNLINETEEILTKICSHCGNNNAILKNVNGWYKTICPSCEEEKK